MAWQIEPTNDSIADSLAAVAPRLFLRAAWPEGYCMTVS
jgi:hypothetical protein